jgi:hypothetical protein
MAGRCEKSGHDKAPGVGVDLQFGFLVAARGILVPSDEDASLTVPGVTATHDGCFSSATVQMWQAAGLLLGVDGVPLPSGASEQRRRGGGVLGVSRSTALRSSCLAAPLVHGSLRLVSFGTTAMAPRRGVDGEIEQVRDTARGGRRLLRLGGDDPTQQDAEAP